MFFIFFMTFFFLI